MVKHAIWSLLYPRRCVVCDEIVEERNSYVCAVCRDKLVYVREPQCMKCGKQLEENEEYCRDCQQMDHEYIQGNALYDYGSVADSIFRFKNLGRVEYADFFAQELYIHKKNWLHAIRPDALVPVPIHKARMHRRGYNQAGELAERLAPYIGIPVCTDLVQRVKNTDALKNLTHAERQNNLKKAFKIVQNDVKLNTIVIIDDIYTTGSTIDEIGKTIHEVCPCKIYYLALAIGRGIS